MLYTNMLIHIQFLTVLWANQNCPACVSLTVPIDQMYQKKVQPKIAFLGTEHNNKRILHWIWILSWGLFFFDTTTCIFTMWLKLHTLDLTFVSYLKNLYFYKMQRCHFYLLCSKNYQFCIRYGKDWNNFKYSSHTWIPFPLRIYFQFYSGTKWITE